MSPRTQGPFVLEVTSRMLGRALRRVRQNLVAYLALFFAIGGTAMAAKPLITGADVADDSLTGADVDEATLSPVPSAANAQNAANADNASLLDNQPPSAFAPSAVEPFHNVGDPGEPEFLDGWFNSEEGAARAGFYKDPWGVVHLKGNVQRASAGGPSVIFILPEGYRPADLMSFGDRYYLSVFPEGAVYTQLPDNAFAVLGGITFRAGY